MQGPIAQALALTCVGNAALSGGDVSGFWPDASVFRFSKSCDFRRVEGERDEEIAADPLAWLQVLRAHEARGLRLHHAPRPRGPNQTLPIDDKMTVGFVGGGPAWLIEQVRGEESLLWQGFNRLGDRQDPQQKIWLNTYLLLGSSPRRDEVIPVGAAGVALRAALDDIAALAKKMESGWLENFDKAIAALASAAPEIGFHEDIARYAGLDPQQRQLFAAVEQGWVFGGMGWWNDNPPGEPLLAEYERTSEQLFRALCDAICAVANASFAA